MDCSDARVAISASLDGEPLEVAPSELATHIAECEGCRLWQERAHTVTRRVRLAPAVPAPTISRELLQAVRDGLPTSARRRRRLQATRLALLLVAAAQVALAVPALILGADREAPLHVAHEMGSFDMALAVGFLIVAVQPGRARGMHLLVGAAAALLSVTAVIDLAAGRTSLGDEAPHLLVVIGWMLMFRLTDSIPSGHGLGYGRELAWMRRTAMAVERPLAAPAGAGHDLGAATAPPVRRAAGA